MSTKPASAAIAMNLIDNEITGRILKILENAIQPITVNEIIDIMQKPQSQVSAGLAKLRGAGLVNSPPLTGRQRYYTVNTIRYFVLKNLHRDVTKNFVKT